MNPDPLSQLRPLHTPEVIGWWPPAPGWWVLGLLLLALLGGLLFWGINRYRARAYRRQALAELALIRQNYNAHADKAYLLSSVSGLLKRVCITRFGRARTAGLSNRQWLEFLDQTGNTQAFTQGSGKVIVTQRFRPDPDFDGDSLLQLIQQWLKKQT